MGEREKERERVLIINKPVRKLTCTGDAATSKPATEPPKTLPSCPDSATLRPPVRLFLPGTSDSMKEPESDNISNRPYMMYTKC